MKSLRASLSALFLVLFLFEGFDSLSFEQAPQKDAAQYVTMAWNIAQHAIFSMDSGDAKTVSPTAYREPGYPALLAFGILVSPDLKEAPLESLLNDDFQPHLKFLKMLQVALLLVTAIASAGAVLVITGSELLAWVTLFLSGLDTALHRMSDTFLSEPLITMLLALLCLLLALAARKPTLPRCAGAGAILALLALTRAAFFYLWIPPALLLAVLVIRRPALRRTMLRGSLAFLVGFAALTGPWMVRNYIQFGRFFIAERGGMILAIRAETNMMTRDEYLASFLYWSNSSFLKEMMDRHFEEATLARLDPSAEGGFVQLARARRRALNDELKDSSAADERLFEESMRKIREHPVRHLLATLPIGYRGLYVKSPLSVCLLLWIVFFTALMVAARAGDWAAVAALTPALMSFLFHAFLTHNIPRYNSVLIPALWIALAICLHHWGRSRVGAA